MSCKDKANEKGKTMAKNKTYTIKHDEWDYSGMNPAYIDDTVGIMVELYLENDKTVKLLGSSTSMIDDGNVYYYDLTCSSFANRAWNNVFGDIDDVFNDDGEVIVDIDVPEWFIEHAQKLMDIDHDYEDIFVNVFENYDGDFVIDNMRNAIRKYLVDNNIDSDDYTIDGILFVAENTGMMWYSYAENRYYISI